LPEAEINPDVPTVVGIDGRKMSKSYDNTIEIFSDEKALRQKIARIVTDATPVADPKDPAKCNLYATISLFLNEQERADLADHYRRGGVKYSDVKKELFERMLVRFKEARKRRSELSRDPDGIRRLLLKGAEKAREKARPTLKSVREKVGLLY
jgi:tryptophanyl-tRNA synthetase